MEMAFNNFSNGCPFKGTVSGDDGWDKTMEW
jgi:hypothetical protein